QEVRFVFFFFFQAEDGIRDFHVTGVQTCALPISTRTSCRWSGTSGCCPKPWRPRGSGCGASSSAWRSKKVEGKRISVCHLISQQIGRASCRERVEKWGGALVATKKIVRAAVPYS